MRKVDVELMLNLENFEIMLTLIRKYLKKLVAIKGSQENLEGNNRNLYVPVF